MFSYDRFNLSYRIDAIENNANLTRKVMIKPRSEQPKKFANEPTDVVSCIIKLDWWIQPTFKYTDILHQEEVTDVG